MEGKDKRLDPTQRTRAFKASILVILILIGLGVGLIVNALNTVLSPETELREVLEAPLKLQTVLDYPSALVLTLLLFLFIDFARQPKTPKRFLELRQRSEDVSMDAKRIGRMLVVVLQYSLLLLAGVWVFFAVWAVKAITTISLVWSMRRTPGFGVEAKLKSESPDDLVKHQDEKRFALEKGILSGMAISGYTGLAISVSLLATLGQYDYIILIVVIAVLFLVPFLYLPMNASTMGRRSRLFVESAVPRVGLAAVMVGIGLIRGEWIWIMGFLVILVTLSLWILHLYLLVGEDDLAEHVEELSLRFSLLKRVLQIGEDLRVIVSVPTITVMERLTRVHTAILGIGLTLFLGYATLSKWIWPSGSLVALYTATLAVHVTLTVAMASIGGLFSKSNADERGTTDSGSLSVRGLAKGLCAISAFGILLSFAGLIGNLAILSGGIRFGVVHFSAAWNVGLVNRFVLLFSVAVIIEIVVQLTRLIRSR